MNDVLTRKAGALLLASENLRGIMLMIAARLVFTGSDTFTKLAGENLPASEVLALRNGIALPIVLFMAWRLNGLAYKSALRDRIIMTRSIVEGLGTVAFVIALPYVMLGQSTVILLTVPIILVALSAIFLKEEVGWRRWTAIIVGFIGVMMVAGPFGERPTFFLLLTQVTAVLWAIRDLMTSRIVGRIPSVTVALITTAVVGLLGLPGAFFQEWRGLGAQELLFLLASGSLVAIANFLYIDALRTGAISVVAPFRYTGALWATIAGFLVWGDIPDWLGVVGTLFIIGSGLYTFYRELELVKARRSAEINTPGRL